MKPGFTPGLEHELRRVVTRELCVRGMRGVPKVFATAEMIRLMEIAAYQLLQPFLEPGESSVGIAVDIRHTAATPLGMKVRAVARLARVEGSRCFFQVSAFDEKEPIGSGTHERYIIDIARFRARAREKTR